MKSSQKFKTWYFILFLILLNLCLAILSTPITELGDASTYILLSKTFLGIEEVNLSHRSPLYSILLAGFMCLFTPPFLYKFVVLFQYFLVGLSAWYTFAIFRQLFSKNRHAILTSILFNLSLATIYYANIVLTEILALFLVVLSTYYILRIANKINYKNIIILSILLSFLALARFNTIPLILTYLSLLIFALIWSRTPLIKSLISISLLLIPYLIILNLWSLNNYYQNNFYGLFPKTTSGISRNVVVASIRKENVVSEENEPILKIFLNARNNYLYTIQNRNKGSLASLDKFGMLEDIYSGYPIYTLALADLKSFFEMDRSAGEYELNSKLDKFYSEIRRQNSKFIFKMRFVSFASGLRASTSSLPMYYGNINSNILHPVIFKIYKFSMLIISITVLSFSILFLLSMVHNRQAIKLPLLISFAIVWSFWGINIFFITLNDANRYKFPADPFLFGLFIFYVSKLVTKVLHLRKSKMKSIRFGM